MDFSSDTAAPAHPSVLEALAKANEGPAASYGNDAVTAELRGVLENVLETEDFDFWLCASGTASNALALSCFCPPTGAVLCHAGAHIAVDERGAPEFFSGGGKLQLRHSFSSKSGGGGVQVLLRRRPLWDEPVTDDCFEVREGGCGPPAAVCAAGALAQRAEDMLYCRTLFVSVDPFLRCRFNETIVPAEFVSNSSHPRTAVALPLGGGRARVQLRGPRLELVRARRGRVALRGGGAVVALEGLGLPRAGAHLLDDVVEELLGPDLGVQGPRRGRRLDGPELVLAGCEQRGELGRRVRRPGVVGRHPRVPAFLLLLEHGPDKILPVAA